MPTDLTAAAGRERRSPPAPWLDQMDTSERLASATHADRIFDAIETALITGAIALGSRLAEETLSRRFGVSRGPLREALRRLEGRGLVERLPHAGVRVVRMARADLIELYEIREPLEGMACRLAAQRITGEEIATLRALLRDHATSETFRSGEHHGASDFHFVIAKASRSRRLEQLLCKDLYSLIRLCRIRIARAPGRLARAARDHQRILDAIEERDGDLAELLMRRHIALARKEIEQDPATEG